MEILKIEVFFESKRTGGLPDGKQSPPPIKPVASRDLRLNVNIILSLIDATECFLDLSWWTDIRADKKSMHYVLIRNDTLLHCP